MSFASLVVIFLLVLDPFGNIAIFTSTLKACPPPQRLRIIVRECLIAYLVLLVFLIGGKQFLGLLHISQPSLGIAGGIILFLIALKMVFPSIGVQIAEPEKEPFIVPLAIPAIAGPSAMATVILLVSKAPEQQPMIALAVSVVILFSMLVLCLSDLIVRLAGKSGVAAMERLMGLLLTAVAVEMFMQGVKTFLAAR